MGSTVEAKRLPPAAGDADEEARLKHEEEEHDIDEEHERANGSRPRRKRRRTELQTSDKKYGCPDPGCGKKYSRLEHLYRHQLNRKFSKLSRVTMLHPRTCSTQGTLDGIGVLFTD